MVRRFPGGILVGQNATDPLGLTPKQQVDGAIATAVAAAPFVPRLAGAITGEVFFDWSRHTAGALPAADDAGVPVYLKRYSTTDTPILRSNGGIVMMVADMTDVVSGNGAVYLNQALPSARQVKRITADFAFGPGTPSSTCIALCAWADVTMPVPEKAPIHVSISVTSYDIAYYDASGAGAVTLASGTFSTPLAQDWSPLHAEVEVIGNQLCVTLPDGTYVESVANTNVSALPGIVACWELFQPVGACRVGVIRGTADGWSRSPLTPTEGRVARLARKTFPPSIQVDPTTGNIGIQAPAVSWATFLTSGVMACTDAYAVNQPSQDFYLTRKDWVNRQFFGIVTATKTAAYTANPGEFVPVDASAGPVTITLPTVAAAQAATGGGVAVKKIDNSTNAVTIAVAAGSGNTIGFQAAATTTISTQYQVAEVRPASSTNWGITGGQLALASLDARYVRPTLATAKGDLLAASGSAVLARLGVGTDGQVLTADAAQALGVKWATPAAGGATAPRAVSGSTTATVDVSVAGDVDLTCTGDTAISFTGTPANGRVLVITALASGAGRTPSVPGTVGLTTGVTSRSLAIPSAGKGRFVLRYSSLGTAGWSLDSAYLLA